MKKKKKNSNYNPTFGGTTLTEQNNPHRTSKSFVIFVSAFVALVLIAGIIFGVSFGIKNANAVVKYNGMTLNREEAGFFASYYKYQYMTALSKQGVEASDTEAFWSSKANAVNSYAELLEYYTREYLKQILVSNYLYDAYCKLSANEKKDLKLAAKEILDYQASSSVDNFNKSAEKFGFDYDTFEKATVMLYKSSFLTSSMFGTNGTSIASDTDRCEDFLSKYTRVKLMFIRTDRDFKYDEDGDRIESDGQDVLFELSAEEKAKRASDIATIKSAIEGFNNGGAVQMSPTMFDSYLATYKSGYDDRDKNGFYFHEKSEYTKEFSEAYGDIVTRALEMENNSYSEIEFDEGICFIYKYTPATGAYTEKSNSACFGDFYKNTAADTVNTMVNELIKQVEFTDNIEEFDFVKLPYNSILYPRF